MLLMMSLSQLCRDPLNAGAAASFVGCYTACYAQRFAVTIGSISSGLRGASLAVQNVACRGLFQRWLALCAIARGDAALFSHCFAQACSGAQNQQKNALLLHMSRRLDAFDGLLDCGLLLQAACSGSEFETGN